MVDRRETKILSFLLSIYILIEWITTIKFGPIRNAIAAIGLSRPLASSFVWAISTLPLLILLWKFRSRLPRTPKISHFKRITIVYGFLFSTIVLGTFYKESAVKAFPEKNEVFTQSTKKEIDDAPERYKNNIRFQTSIVSPVAEEIAFRFALITLVLLPLGVSRLGGLLISTIAFALVHYTVYESIMIPQIAIIGFFLGTSYLICGLGYSILFHVIFNSLTSGQILETIDAFQAIESVALQAIIFISMILLTAYAVGIALNHFYKFMRQPS